jgi:hypothetical protein
VKPTKAKSLQTSLLVRIIVLREKSSISSFFLSIKVFGFGAGCRLL